MITRVLVVLMVCLAAKNSFCQPTPIGGIINLYTPIVDFGSTCLNTLSVVDASGFSAGDRVLVIQMKGAEINQDNDQTYGDIVQINGAGNYEFGTVASLNGNVVTLENNLVNNYNINGLVQLIFVPQYSSATVIALLTALPWNGNVGGVLAFEVSGDLTLNATVNLTGTGFRGGNVSANLYQQSLCSSTDYFFSANQALGAGKGEGIAALPSNMMTGRGALANGGGGANHLNAGGGGGSNVTAGGVGGNEWSGCASFANGGIGGKPMNFPNKLFLGGGGGGGHQNNTQATPGGNGGGIIIVKANSLISNGFTISNNGDPVFAQAGLDGAGGGGAGGSTILDVSSYTGSITVTANGGDGGSVNNGFTGGATGGQCHGPGGGGSGGLIGVTTAVLPANILSSSTGGAPGLNVNPESNCEGNSYGATAGQNGITRVNVVLNEGTIPPDNSVVDLGSDQTICSGQTITLDPGLNMVGLWQDGSIQETYLVSMPGIYSVSIESACGNSMDEILIILEDMAELNLPPTFAFCQGNSVVIGVPENPQLSYLWNNGAATSQISVSEVGNYTLTASINGLCENSANTSVVEVPPPDVIVNGPTLLCEGESSTLFATGDAGVYLWNNGTVGSVLQINSPGTYTVTLTTAQGCMNSASITVGNSIGSNVYIDGPSSICEDDEVTITAIGSGGSLLWEDGSSQPQRTITHAGLYSVTETISDGCSSTSMHQISSVPLPIIFVNDAEFCSSDTLYLTAISPNSNLNWSGFNDGSTLVVSQAGIYDVLGENSCGITRRAVTITEVTCSCYAYIPNAFSPNGDGVNDLFAPVISCEPPNYSLQVFNRWGQLIFESRDVFKKWNGSSIQNTDYFVESGEYVYIVKYDNPLYPLEEINTLIGSVMLIR